jgi:hypothetical protein
MLGGDETCQVSREVFGYKSSRPFDDPAWNFAPDHRLNWLQCILNGGEPTMPLSTATKAAAACMVGRLALRLNRKLVWDFDAGGFIDDAEANDLREDLVAGNPWTVRL